MRRCVLLAVAVATIACGGDDEQQPAPIDAAVVDGAVIDGPPIDTPQAIDAAPPLDAANGQVWIRGTNITGGANQIVLAFVRPQAGGGPLGNICQQVTSDPFSFVATAQTNSGNPCTLTGAATIPDGTYTVQAGLYTPGQMTPNRCASTTVTVAGSGDVTLPAFAACP